jgi:UDP-N-acetylmuramyl pentapeptide phosphotransferase/UDP-N-acetylglucosamine-1-phosphate transferase
MFELGRIFAQCLTIFIIVAIINSINFVDGIDGLALSVCILFIFCFDFFINSYSPYIMISIILVTSLIPLYYFNFSKKNKVFLGDSGSLFLGGIVSILVIYILSNDYIIKPEFDLHKILFVISILLYPIIDVIRIFFLRLINGKSPFQPDKNHLHHLLLKKTKNHFYTTLIIISISIFFIILMQVLF